MKATFFGLKGLPSQVLHLSRFRMSAISRSQYWSRSLFDGRDELRFELADLSDWQWAIEHQGAHSSARQAYMGSDLLRLDQGHVVDEQPHDAFTLAGIDARVLPDFR
jgi:hypothetical protein